MSAPTTDHAVLLRYHEVALKGDNRRWFEDRLAGNARKLMRRALGDEAPLKLVHQRGRILVHTEWNAKVKEALGRVFGLSSFSPMRVIPTDLEGLERAAIEEVETHFASHGRPSTFRVTSKRSDKVLSMTSTDIDRRVGGAVKQRFPELSVSLKEAELTIGLEIHADRTYVWREKVPGPGGLPVGTNGHFLTLLSGGLDSPVAAIQMLKRGAQTTFLHFYGTPFVGQEVLEKVEDLARLVNRFQPDPRALLIVPFGKIQERIALATHSKLRTVLYRRMMIRIASEIAKARGMQALITGEALGQVASQTIENMTTIDAAGSLPILRPLVGYDKDEIIQRAREWGTFDVAIRPGVDCCTLFADRHPNTRSTRQLAEEQEALFPMEEMVQEAIASLEIRDLR